MCEQMLYAAITAWWSPPFCAAAALAPISPPARFVTLRFSLHLPRPPCAGPAAEPLLVPVRDVVHTYGQGAPGAADLAPRR